MTKTPERWYRKAELREAGVPYSSDYVRELIREGKFPKPVRVGRCAVWPASVIAKWQEDVLASQPKPKTAGGGST